VIARDRNTKNSADQHRCAEEQIQKTRKIVGLARAELEANDQEAKSLGWKQKSADLDG
jgi:hypothetical protein